MSNPHQEEAQRQIEYLDKLRERNKRERAGWGPTPLQAQQHQTGAATGLTFRIPVGKYQLGWREKLLFNETQERQDRRKEKLEEIDDLSKVIVEHWHEFNRLHTNTYKYIDKKQRLDWKMSSQKRLDDFRKQFQSWLATNKRVGLCPEQYLTRWYTNYMNDLWTSEDVRTFYSGVREMTGPQHSRPESYGKNTKHEAKIHEMTMLTKHALPGDMNNRWKHLTPSASEAAIQAPPMQRSSGAPAPARRKSQPWGGPAHGPPIDFKSAPASKSHFLNGNAAVQEQRQQSQSFQQKTFPGYSVNDTLPYLAGGNMRA
eukprot:SAG22_NODE_663_length_8042_cov_12.157371_1_plen_314_part_00